MVVGSKKAERKIFFIQSYDDILIRYFFVNDILGPQRHPSLTATASGFPTACRREAEMPSSGATGLASELDIDFHPYG